MVEISSAQQVQKPSTAGYLIDHLAFFFFFSQAFPLCVFLRHQNPHTDLESRVFHAGFKLEVWLKVVSPSPSDSSHIRRVEGNKNHPLKYFHRIHTEGPGVAVFPEVWTFRPKPWGTRVQLAPRTRLTAETDPRWCTGRPDPGTSPLIQSLFPPRSWTAQKN